MAQCAVSAAPSSRRSTEHWQEVIASLPPDATPSDTTNTTTNPNNGIGKTSAAMGKKRSSKRSLLSDISNLASKENLDLEFSRKKSKTDITSASIPKTKGKKASIPKTSKSSNQKSIMSYFKSS